jgi:uncharacterized protein YidB (DUF937 family)
MGLFYVLRERRGATFLLGGLLTGGVGAALVATVVRHFRRRSRERLLSAEHPAQPVSSDEVEHALGEERIQWLIRRTGLTRDDLIAGLRFSTEVEPELISNE